MPDTKVERVIASIRADIAAGRLQPGDRLPSIARLAAEHDVSVATVRIALTVLKDSNVIRSERGRAFFVV